jgi:LmbE family N-acetylglucosaminyl deacetylase
VSAETRRLGRAIRGAGSWLRGGGEDLEGRVVAVSVHLDDAVFSVGAALAQAARRGADVTILTVLGNDPGDDRTARKWDAQAGFTTVAEAALGRREEDRLACAIVGAKPVWLAFGDKTHGLGAPPEQVAEATLAELRGADVVLVPGFPLLHEDHRLVVELLGERVDAPRVGRFVEQPYAALWTAGPDEGEWLPLAASLRDRRAKLRASRAYGSQLPLLGDHVVRRTARYELLRGGEAVSWRS